MSRRGVFAWAVVFMLLSNLGTFIIELDPNQPTNTHTEETHHE